MTTQNEIQELKADHEADRKKLAGVSAEVTLMLASLHKAKEELTK
ncbi:hypothetical protein [Glutamicibacter protophormiae]|nr:hypothetical protein [Glutamicibacter protophormiae]